MTKTWNFNGREYTMTKSGYGQYTLNGYHCTNSIIWDWCDDDEDESKNLEALNAAESFVNAHED